jgi:hypothetical protein
VLVLLPSAFANPSITFVLNSCGAQVVRESLPLFVRDSYLVNDSMSLERQSLNSVEPFSAGSQARPSAAMQAALMASTRAPLGTLQEEESFCDDSASAPGGVPALAGRAPTFFQKAAAKAAKAAGGVAGVEEHDLPRNLPDPQVLGGGVTAMDITPVKPAVAGAGVYLRCWAGHTLACLPQVPLCSISPASQKHM